MEFIESLHGSPLTTEEVAAILESEETFAQYLATLTPLQIAAYKNQIETGQITMPDENVKNAFIKLLDLLQPEAEAHEQELREQILPLARGIATAVKMYEQIEELEAIEASL